MKKTILFGLAVSIALVSCNKDQQISTVPQNEGKDFVVEAVLDPSTKMDYTARTDGSYKATFLTSGTDALWAYGYDAAGKLVGSPVKLAIDLTTLSADKRSATFKANSVSLPSGITKFVVYLANGGTTINFGTDTLTVDLSKQASLAVSNNLHVICSEIAASDVKESDDAYTVSGIALQYLTSLVKFDLKMPEGIRPDLSASFIEVTGEGIHNTLAVSGKGIVASDSKLGELTLTPVAIDTATNVVTAYATVLASDNFAGSKVTLWYDEISYAADFAPASALAGGKAYTAARTLVQGAFSKELWKANDAGSLDWVATGVTSDAAWLSFASNKLSWAENTEGAIRTATATDANGSKYTITQIGAAGFAGSWSFSTKVFAPNTNIGMSASTGKDITLTIAAKEGTTANDGSKEITNNLAISGFINTYVAEGVVDIDYAAKTFRFGVFFNGKKAQAVSTGKADYPYITLLPELGTGWGSYNFCPVPFNGDTNYGWLWFVVDDADNMHYGQADWYKMDGKDVLGLAFCACKTEEPSPTDYASVNAASGYDVIHQCNPATSTTGFKLVRK